MTEETQDVQTDIWARPSWDAFWMAQAMLVATRTTCRRRSVGCLLVDGNNRQVSSGYNGTPPNSPHCLEEPCAGASYPSGEGRDKCLSSHAEISALVALADRTSVYTAYVTTAPCTDCIKALMLTHCRRIVFCDDYVDSGLSAARWTKSGREWIRLPNEMWRAAMHTALNYQALTKKRAEVRLWKP